MDGNVRALKDIASGSGAEVIVVTNQKWAVDVALIKRRLECGLAKLFAYGVPVVGVIASPEEDWFRKPFPGMPRLAMYGRPMPPKILMVGDAAGRPGDHSAADRLLAYNMGADFMTPEEMVAVAGGGPERPVVGQEQCWAAGGCGPLSPEIMRRLLSEGPPVARPLEGPEIVVLVGLPGSGKTCLAAAYERAGYMRLSQDEHRKDVAGLLSGSRVVVDRANVTPVARAPLIRYARSIGVPCRCVCILEDPHFSYNKMACRSAMAGTLRVPTVAYRKMLKGFVMPSLQEGFSSVEVAGRTGSGEAWEECMSWLCGCPVLV